MVPILLHHLHRLSSQARQRATRAGELAAQARDPVVAELARLQSARDLELLNLFHLLAWALRPAPDSPSPTLASRFRAAWLGFWRG